MPPSGPDLLLYIKIWGFNTIALTWGNELGSDLHPSDLAVNL